MYAGSCSALSNSQNVTKPYIPFFKTVGFLKISASSSLLRRGKNHYACISVHNGHDQAPEHVFLRDQNPLSFTTPPHESWKVKVERSGKGRTPPPIFIY